MSLSARPAARNMSSPRRWSLPVALRLVLGLLLLIAVGTLLLLLPGVGTARRLQLNEALFTAVSALSVTGLSLIVPGRDLTLLGQSILLLLIQVGGVGFMVVAVLLFKLLGRHITLSDRLALRDSLGLVSLRALRQLTRRIMLTVLVIEGVGAALLWLHWRDTLGDSRALFFGIFHAVSAFSNAGFELWSGSPGHVGGMPHDAWSLTILGTLIVLGSLGIPVLYELATWLRLRQLSLHTRLTLAISALLIACGSLGMLLAEGRAGGLLADMSWDQRLVLAQFQSISARTAGFSAVPSFESFTPASQLLMLALMFIGGAPASMGGGITTGTAAVLLIALWSFVQGKPTAQIGGWSIETGTVRRAAAVLTVSLLLVLLATWLILITHTTTLDAAVFEVVSAFATTGLSLAFTAELNVFGQIVIMVMMFWGRLGALTLVVALAQQRRAARVQYPEAPVLIG